MASKVRYEAKDGTVSWKVRFRIGNASRSETFSTSKNADRFIKLVDAVGGARARAILEETQATDVLEHAIRDVAEQWLEWKGAKRKDGTLIHVSSPYTIVRYGQLIRNQIIPHFGDKPINLVTHGEVQEWVDELADTLAAKTVGDAHSVLHAIYKWAGSKAKGIAIINPCTETVLPRKKKNIAKGLRPNEWQILYTAAREVSDDAADLLLFLVSSGWRWSEAVAPQAMDVDDFGSDGLWINMGRILRRVENGAYEFIDDEAKSVAGLRRTRMSGEAAEMIRRRLKGLAPGDLLFTNETGGKWYYTGFYSRYWTRPTGYRDAAPSRKRILEVAAERGLTRPISLHMLRHTHAVLMLLSGEHPASVSKRLGHEKITTTTSVYGSLIQDVSDTGLDRFEAMLGGGDISGLAEIVDVTPVEIEGD